LDFVFRASYLKYMNLKDFLTSRDKPPELYWSLVIEKGWVQAGIWYIGETSAEVLDISPGAAWETDDELVGACDAALSSCAGKLPENYEEPSKTVFGVNSSWVKDGEIQEEYLAKIKVVCTELSLTPVGFVVLPEAIAHLYKFEEDAPLSAIVIGLGPDNLEISVFKLGNLIGTTSVARSVSVTEDVTEGLSRFEGAAPLPSRMVIFDGKGGELEEAKEELMKASWEGNGKMKFLHTPKAEILASDRKVLAICLAGALEIGNVTGVSEKPSFTEETTEAETEGQRGEIENVTEPDEQTSAEDLGFVVGEDVTKSQKQQQEIYVPPVVTPPAPSTELYPQRTNPQGTKSLFNNFSSRFSIKGPKVGSVRSKTPIYFILALLLIAALGLGGYWWFIPKADVTVFVAPKSFQEQASISFSTTGVFDESNAIIPAQVVTSQASGDKTKSATGTKLIGDKATGSVQIANGNGTPINLPAGTILTSTAGLKFVTNTEASISGQLIPGSPGTATLAVTAGDVGAQYNLAKGEIFKVGIFDKSQVAATSQADFSGGSSQQITAVSADDQTSLESDLKSELSGEAMSGLSNKITDNQYLVNDLAGLDTTSETFDHNIGDTADTLKLSLTVNATGVAADKTKLLQYVTDTIKGKIPAGYALNSSQINFKFTFVSKQNGNYVYTADISANFLPKINSASIITEIAGKTTPVATNYLSSVPGFTRAIIDLKYPLPLPGPLRTLPHLDKNITIDVAPDQ
jgi:hypothetical protein